MLNFVEKRFNGVAHDANRAVALDRIAHFFGRGETDFDVGRLGHTRETPNEREAIAARTFARAIDIVKCFAFF